MTELDLYMKRACGLFMGAAIGDAASQPLEWIYDLTKLGEAVGSHDPAFLSVSHNPFFRITAGSNTCYFHQSSSVALCLLERSDFAMEDLQRTFHNSFGSHTAYETDRTLKPIAGPWRNFCVTHFVHRYEEGFRFPKTGCTTDFQSDCYFRILPIAIVYAGHPKYLDIAEEVISMVQNSEESKAFGLCFARIVEIYLLAESPFPLNIRSVVYKLVMTLCDPLRPHPTTFDPDVITCLQRATSRLDTPYVEFQQLVGQGCGADMCLSGMIHTLARFPSDFSGAIRSLLTGGGDMVSRCALTGALIGCSLATLEGSTHAWPHEWQEKTLLAAEYQQTVEGLVALRREIHLTSPPHAVSASLSSSATAAAGSLPIGVAGRCEVIE